MHLKYIEIKRHLHRFDLVSLTEMQLSIQPQVGSLLVEERNKCHSFWFDDICFNMELVASQNNT